MYVVLGCRSPPPKPKKRAQHTDANKKLGNSSLNQLIAKQTKKYSKRTQTDSTKTENTEGSCTSKISLLGETVSYPSQPIVIAYQLLTFHISFVHTRQVLDRYSSSQVVISLTCLLFAFHIIINSRHKNK